jgi:Na+/H+ antiporter NhaD/arsenite permease-like protein
MDIMETIETFSDFLRKLGVPNVLAIGIVVMVLWLLISGIRKGLKKGRQNQGNSEKNNEEE